MANYNSYPYSRMFSFIERKCDILNDEKNYIKYILSMEYANSLDELIKIYNNSYKILAYLFFENKRLPKNWYVTETWGHDNNWLLDDLNFCLNENILNWIRKQNMPTESQALACLANLHDSKNTNYVQNQILSIVVPKVYKGIEHLSRVRSNLTNIRKLIEKGARDLRVKSQYISNCRYMSGNGRIFDIAEISVGNDIGINFENLKEEYENEIIRIKKEEEEKQRIEKEKGIKLKAIGIILSIIYIVIVVIWYINNLSIFEDGWKYYLFFVFVGIICLLMSYRITRKRKRKKKLSESELKCEREFKKAAIVLFSLPLWLPIIAFINFIVHGIFKAIFIILVILALISLL